MSGEGGGPGTPRPVVTLTWPEVISASIVGLMRRVQNLKLGSGAVYGAPRDEWAADVEGACAEAALAKHLGAWWSGAVGDTRAADVGRLQVRQTAHRDGRLVLHPRDADGAVFVLLVGAAPTFLVAGCIRCGDGKRPEFWRDPTGKGRPAYFVPQDRLSPLAEVAVARRAAG